MYNIFISSKHPTVAYYHTQHWHITGYLSITYNFKQILFVLWDPILHNTILHSIAPHSEFCRDGLMIVDQPKHAVKIKLNEWILLCLTDIILLSSSVKTQRILPVKIKIHNSLVVQSQTSLYTDYTTVFRRYTYIYKI